MENNNQEQLTNETFTPEVDNVVTDQAAPISKAKSIYPHENVVNKEYIIKRITLAERGNWFGKDFNKDAERIRPRFVIECGHNGSTWNTGLTNAEEDLYTDLFKISLSKYEPTSDPHPFYSKKENKLDLTDTLILNTRNPRDFLKIKLAQQDEKIAPSKSEFENGNYPSATHYMYSNELEQKTVSERITKKAKAYSSLNSLSISNLRTVVEVFYNSSFDDASEIQLKTQYENAIEENLTYLVKVLEKDDLTRNYESSLIKALDRQIIQEYDNGHIYYLDKKIGNDIPSAAIYLKAPENQELFIKIKGKLIN